MAGLYGLTIGVIIIGIGSARKKDQRDVWLIWTNDRCHHHRHRFCTHVRRIKEMAEPVFLNLYGAQDSRNRCQGIKSASLCSMAGRYDNPIPTRCLAPIDFLKIPALV
jgi:hypothetical protein